MSEVTDFILNLNGAMSEQYRRSDKRSMWDIWTMVIDKIKNSQKIKFNHHYERYEDMSSTGRIQVFIENDCDVIISIIPDIDNNTKMLSAQFCTQHGGGHSPNVRDALLALARAIEEDNTLNPQIK